MTAEEWPKEPLELCETAMGIGTIMCDEVIHEQERLLSIWGVEYLLDKSTHPATSSQVMATEQVSP